MRRTAVLTLVLATLAAACTDNSHPLAPLPHAALLDAAPRAQPVTVMTRNLFLGADVGLLLSAPDPAQIPFIVAALWSQVIANDFPQRAGALADEVAASRPHLIGLQETATYFLQFPGDVLAGNPVQASDVVYDYLQILLDALAERGLDYRVAAEIANMDVELPMATLAGLADIRLQLRDVVLARADVDIANPQSANFSINASTVIAGAVPFTILRGWAAVDANIDGRRIHFVTTHLEAFSPLVNAAQGAELLAVIADRPNPVVLLGDFNVTPDGARGPTYANVIGAGFADVWTDANPGDDGPTCCFAADLSSTERALTTRIDFVFVRDAFDGTDIVGSTEAELTGNQLSDRTHGGLWPSDHAGLVARLRLPQGRGLAGW